MEQWYTAAPQWFGLAPWVAALVIWHSTGGAPSVAVGAVVRRAAARSNQENSEERDSGIGLRSGCSLPGGAHTKLGEAATSRGPE